MSSVPLPSDAAPRRAERQAELRPDPAPLLAPLSAAVRAGFGQLPVVADHSLCGDALFGDAALIELLDRFPRRDLHALSMGGDPTRSDQDRVALHDGVCGAELLLAARRGRLRLDLQHLERADVRCRTLIRGLYAELAAQLPGFGADPGHATLLISSPHAVVHYHVDAPGSVLWQLRGRQRVWVHPALDRYFVERDELEDVFAGVRCGDLPWDPSYDAASEVVDLEPGQWMAWPQNAPYRVANLDSLSVSLCTEHFTPQGRRRARVYKANRFLRTRWAMQGLSCSESGAGALLKTAVHALARAAGLDPLPPRPQAPAGLRIAGGEPGGMLPLQDSFAAASSGGCPMQGQGARRQCAPANARPAAEPVQA